MRLLYAAFMIVGILIAVRLIWVQTASPAGKHNAEILGDGVFRTTEIAAHRGAILSRDGEPLAISSLRYNVEMDFAAEGIRKATTETYSKNADSLARLLSDFFNKEDAAKNGYKHIALDGYRKILVEGREKGKNRSYKLFPRLVTIDEWSILRQYPILNGNLGYVYYTRAEEKRIYPSGDMARQTIGRYTPIVIEDTKDGDTIRKNVAGTGIELIYNDALKGHNGKVKEQWIAHGFWSRVDDPKNILPENGADVVTTIDAGLQRLADEKLREMLQQQQASFGVAIVMEVKTGDVLCMVSLGSGKERGNEYSERVFNHALKTGMSPGSTMKLATTMALLEIGGYSLATEVNTEHSQSRVPVIIGNTSVEDSHDVDKGGDGYVSLLDGFAHSSNVYFAKAVYEKFKDNPSKYTNYLASLKFNSTVGLKEYGEAEGFLAMANTPEWKKRGSTGTCLPRLAYGYEMAVPPIHMITFYNGVANEGRMVAPRLVDRIERNGEVVEQMPITTIIPHMCSKRTLTLLDSCLKAASQRTGRKFVSLPTTFGCKTGTAQVWTNFISRGTQDHIQMQNGMDKNDKYYYGSIVCTMPAENPKYTILVGVCKQRTDDSSTYYGIDLSGPVANDIMTYLYANDPKIHATIESPEVQHAPTNIKAGRSSDVVEVSRKLGAKHKSENKGNAWSYADIDDTGKSTVKGLTTDIEKVPDVRNMGLSDAIYLLESIGLKVTHSGTGAVTSQSIKPGTNLASASNTIHLTLKI